MQNNSLGVGGFLQRPYHYPPDASNVSPTYSENSSRSNSQGYDTFVAARRSNFDMAARKSTDTAAVRKKASLVGLGAIFHRKDSNEKRTAKANSQALAQAQAQENVQAQPQAQDRTKSQEVIKPAPKRRGPKPDSKPAMNRRQELNRQAQRTHRERKELYAKSLENNNILLKEQLANMMKQRDTYCHENSILKELLRVNNIPYHVSPLSIDMVPQNHTYGTVNAYASSDIDFASTPQAGSVRNNSYPAPASSYGSSSTNATSPSNGVPELSPEVTNMSLEPAQTTQSAVNGGQSSQLVQTTDYSSLALTTGPTSVANETTNGYVYNTSSNHATASSGADCVQATTSVDSVMSTGDASDHNTSSTGQQIAQLENENVIKREVFGDTLHTNVDLPVANQNHSIPNMEMDSWGYSFIFDLESSCRDHAKLMIQRGAAHDSTELSGHAMMLSCPPHSYIQDSLTNPELEYPLKWTKAPMQDYRVMTSGARAVDMNGEISPVEALLMIRRDSRYTTLTVDELNTIKTTLAEKSRCYGFGAMLEEYEVRDAMDDITAARMGPAAIAYAQAQRAAGQNPIFTGFPQYSNSVSTYSNPGFTAQATAGSNQKCGYDIQSLPAPNSHYNGSMFPQNSTPYHNGVQQMYNIGYQ